MKKKEINLAAEIKKREDYNSMCPFPYYSTEVIADLKKKQHMITKKQDYNNVPIHYCKTCLSIALKTVKFEPKNSNLGNGLSDELSREITFCIPCGNTEIESTHITEWEDFYKEKYGHKFLDLNKKDE